MRLNHIELVNYRKYKNAAVDFPDGLTGILGNNGAGKSSLMEAVAWALYGHAAARTGKEDIKRQGSSLSEICQVILDFEIGGAKYRVVRELRGKGLSSNASVIQNGKIAAKGTQPALAYIEKLLDMDREAFFTSFFARQKELNALSDLRPADRKTLIIRMLKIDDVDKAIDLAKQDTRDLKTEINTLASAIQDINTLETQLKKQETAKKTTERTYDEARKKETLLGADFAQSKKTFYTEEKKRDQRDRLLREFEVTKERLNHQTTLLKEREDEEKQLNERGKIQLKLASSIIKTVQSETYDVKTKLTDLTSKMNQVERERKTNERKQEQTRQEIQNEKANLKHLLIIMKKLTNQQRTISKLGPDGKCPTCLRKLGDDHQMIYNHLNEENKQLKKNQLTIEKKLTSLTKTEEYQRKLIADFDQKITSLHTELSVSKNFRDILAQFDQLKVRRPVPAQMIYRKNLELDEKVSVLSQKRDELLALRVNLDRLPQLKEEISSLENKTSGLEDEIKRITETGKKIGFDESDYDKAGKKYDQAREKHHLIQLEIKDIEKEKSLLAQSIDIVRKTIEEQQRLAGKIKRLRTENETIGTLVEIFTDFRKYLIGRIRPALGEKASQLLYELTDGKYDQLELDEEYEMYIYDRGDRFPIDRYSGGEKDLANLCLRLAISLVLTENTGSDFGFIALDEIFGSQDVIRKRNIMEALINLNKRFRQIFLITHVEDVKNQVENIVSVTEDEDGLAKVALE